ncbi:MAG: hypothetical protein BWY31_04636 [Lentisphaerae bacterium ADurb.Bin242]|nr:MAG: hypothetical protein BWY31_04636 [Lentisphaerae bacterium ADurb.Bin242]
MDGGGWRETGLAGRRDAFAYRIELRRVQKRQKRGRRGLRPSGRQSRGGRLPSAGGDRHAASGEFRMEALCGEFRSRRRGWRGALRPGDADLRDPEAGDHRIPPSPDHRFIGIRRGRTRRAEFLERPVFRVESRPGPLVELRRRGFLRQGKRRSAGSDERHRDSAFHRRRDEEGVSGLLRRGRRQSEPLFRRTLARIRRQRTEPLRLRQVQPGRRVRADRPVEPQRLRRASFRNQLDLPPAEKHADGEPWADDSLHKHRRPSGAGQVASPRPDIVQADRSARP